MSSKLGHKIIKGTLWVSFDRFGSMGLQFLINLILARLLTPKDFGYIGIIYVFISVSQTFIDSGFGSALIQKKEPTQTDYSSIFYWNLISSSLIYIILFFCAPLIAIFFDASILCNILRVLGLILIINSLGIVQLNRLRKNISFHIIAIINVSSYLLAGILAIWSALSGLGVWSLVILHLTYSFINISIVWIKVKWIPSFIFSLKSFKELFQFGGYLLGANILQTISLNIQNVIIGKKFSPTVMGFYSQAQRLQDLSTNAIPGITTQIVFPVFSMFQNNKDQLTKVLSTAIKLISYCVFPLLLGLITFAEPLFEFLYGDKWLSSVPYFKVLCFGGLFVCLQNINYYAVAALGKSRALFNWSFYKWGFLLISIFIGSFFNIYGILYGLVISSVNIYMVNCYLVQKYLGFSILYQFKELTPIILTNIVNFIFCLQIEHFFPDLNIFVYFLCFILSYIALTLIFRLGIIKDFKMVKTYIAVR